METTKTKFVLPTLLLARMELHIIGINEFLKEKEMGKVHLNVQMARDCHKDITANLELQADVISSEVTALRKRLAEERSVHAKAQALIKQLEDKIGHKQTNPPPMRKH